MRRILPFLLASSACIASESLETRIETLESQMQNLRMETVYGNHGAKTVTAYPYLHSWGVYVSAEALYWKFFEGGTDYVFNAAPQPIANYHDWMRYVDFDWRFAFRVTAGYKLDNPDFDIWSTYTRFTTDQSSRVTGSTLSRLYPNENVTINADYTSASQSWKISYNVLDLNVGRNYFLRRTFSAHPFVGLRGAIIDQRGKAAWNGSATSDFLYKSKNDFTGIGLVAGTQGRWHFDQHWSVFGSLLGSLLYGRYDVDTTLRQVYPTVTTPLSLDSDTRRVVPNMAADAGVRWEYDAFSYQTRFALTLAYEFQYWWAQNQTLHTKSGTTYAWDRWAEDFGMQGVKLNLGLDF